MWRGQTMWTNERGAQIATQYFIHFHSLAIIWEPFHSLLSRKNWRVSGNLSKNSPQFWTGELSKNAPQTLHLKTYFIDFPNLTEIAIFFFFAKKGPFSMPKCINFFQKNIQWRVWLESSQKSENFRPSPLQLTRRMRKFFENGLSLESLLKMSELDKHII